MTMMRNCLLLNILASLILIFGAHRSPAQNAPVTTCPTLSAAGPGSISLPVTVTGFSNIGALSLTLDYQYSVLQFIQGVAHPQLATLSIADSDLGNGMHRVTMGWFGGGTTLPDGTAIITLTFHYTAGNTALTWHDDGSSCEYADGSYNVLNDIPTADYYINGYFCAVLPAPGPISGNAEVCRGSSGEIYSIDPVANATGYVWSVPDGVMIVNGQNTNVITVDFSANADSGLIQVSASNPCGQGPSGALYVNANEPPVANAGDDFSINYGTSTVLQAASGGTGTFSYHWSPEELLIDPNVQNPQTVIMTSSAIFTLLVTNLGTLCESSDQVMVTITGGPLSVNPVAIPGNTCSGGSSQLFANAGGGSGNYTYQWTSIPAGNPPWSSTLANPVVTPDTTTLYVLSVNDGFTSTNGTASLNVHPLPSATISGGDTLCGSGNTTILTVDLTGTAPWNFVYSFGSTSVNVSNQFITPYLITAIDSGTYILNYVEDAHCTGNTYGSAQVLIFPVPPRPEITVIGNELLSSACCGNQWYFDGAAIPGATSQSYTATQSGAYFVTVTLNGCSSEPSDTVDVTVGIDEIAARNIQFMISPNPSRHSVALGFALPYEGHVVLDIVSISGAKVLIPVDEHRPAGNYSITLDNDRLKPGFYHARLRVKTATDEQVQILKLLKIN